ncbi:THAP domain-containing protein 2-like [Rhopalosiphum padi]|uniref:THAP domain-containing protein 2-like n=1 Tax=Rhopalosiphum padi TaxID=40932 RepID=UPI00298D9016|nr:THAP domain-containing protein 2-like [Rhopalosiphum padi]
MTGKSSKICILCVEPVLKYPRSRMSLHSFPLCPKKRQIWLNRCGLTNAEVSPNCKICSFHFEPTCFKSGVKRRILYPDAVPTIFKKGHVEIANTPLKNTKVMTGKSSKICILCVEPVHKYPRSKMSLHSFPLCPKKRQIWLNRCRLTNAEILPNCKICSFHFEPTCFKSGVKRRILYPDAVPTIFKNDRFEMANTPLKNTKESQKKCNKNGIAVEIYQSHNISLTRAAKKVISVQDRQLRNVVLTRATEKVIEDQNCQGHSISPPKVTKSVITGQTCQSCDISHAKFVMEVYERVASMVTNKKRELDELDKTIMKLEKEKSSLISQLEVANRQIALFNTVN